MYNNHEELKESRAKGNCLMIKETLEEMDESIHESPDRIEKWNINRKEQTSLLCCLGNVVYKRTLFQNKKKKVEILYIDAKLYIVNHWKGIMVRINHPEILGCSAEGHISYNFSV